jgi:hypothetical protein
MGSSSSTSSSCRVTSHSSEVAKWVLLVEKKLPTFQKKHDGCYWWRRNYILFRNNMTGTTSGGETAHSLEVTRRLLLVEEELPTLHK